MPKDHQKLTEMLNYLCNDSIPINERIDEVLNGERKIPFIGLAFVSKILAIHDPKLYHVQNKVIKEGLTSFGLNLPRGSSEGSKYSLINESLKRIMKEAKIDDFAILDSCLWLIHDRINLH